MSKKFGIIALVFGLVSLFLSPYIYLLTAGILLILLTLVTVVLTGGGIIFGAIGIAKDDSKGLAIAGLVISSIAMLNFIAGFMLHFTIGKTGEFFI